jgi:hypothetical protein
MGRSIKNEELRIENEWKELHQPFSITPIGAKLRKAGAGTKKHLAW